jgi:hypothetical protein
VGIEEVSELALRKRFVRAERCPSSMGIDDVSLLIPKSRFTRPVSKSQLSGDRRGQGIAPKKEIIKGE